MTRYFIFLSFRGTAYNGWQIQPGKHTVQGVLTKALSTVLASQTAVTGAGRTDTGVHASFFCAHFDTPRNDLDTDSQLLYNLNGILPDDIAVNRIAKVKPEANARFDALSRTYTYTVTGVKDPFCADSAWLLYWQLDIEKMNEAAAILLKHSDFTSFSRLHGSNKTNICRVTHARWHRDADKLIFTITADRFLRNMVRAVVGTLIDVGRGKITMDQFLDILHNGSRSDAGESMPGNALFLEDVGYN